MKKLFYIIIFIGFILSIKFRLSNAQDVKITNNKFASDENKKNLTSSLSTHLKLKPIDFIDDNRKENISSSSSTSNSNSNGGGLDFLQESFDFNPNDFEDLHENFKKGNLNENKKHLSKLTDDNQKSFQEYFDENPINNEQSSSSSEFDDNDSIDEFQNDSVKAESEKKDKNNVLIIDIEMENDKKHIYKVAKPTKSIKNLKFSTQPSKTITTTTTTTVSPNPLPSSSSLASNENFDKISRSDKSFKFIDTKTIQNDLNSVAILKSLNENNISNNTIPKTINLSKFYLLTKLFDHNLWEANNILVKNLTKYCGENLKIYLNELKLLTPWAIKVSDSSGHYSGQLVYGNEFWLGSKQFCLETNREILSKTQQQIMEVDYSIVKVIINIHKILPKTRTFIIGQCLPKSCCAKDIEKILNLDPGYKLLNSIKTRSAGLSTTNNTSKNDFIAELKIMEVRKIPGEYSMLNERKFYILCGITLTLIILMIISTFYESNLNSNSDIILIAKNNSKCLKHSKNLNNEKNEKNGFELYQISTTQQNNNNENNLNAISDAIQSITKPNEIGILWKILLCFSIQTNAKRILSVEKLSEDSLTCVHGLRTISLLWTIMVHTYLQLYPIGDNKFNRKIAERNFGYQIVGNATYSVDTFFYLSGLLVTLLFLRTTKSDDKENTTEKFFIKGIWKSFLFIFYRIIRLTPAYFFVIVVTELLLKDTYSNSIFPLGVSDHYTCEKYWWRNILYINNWYPLKEFCMIWSWYMANDMQFYIVAVILLVFSVRYFKICAATLLGIFFLSWIVSAYFSFHHNYIHQVADPFASFDFLYNKPWQRLGPYVMGMITGYIYHRVKKPPKISSLMNSTLWIFSLGLLFIIVFGVWNGSLSVLATAFYVSLGHTAWGVGLVWITLSCCWGYAKPVNSILSHPIFYPLSRLTYCAYLIHPVFQIVSAHHLEGSLHLQHILVLTIFFGNAVISFFIAFLISITFEAPVVRLLKIIFQK